MRAILILLVSLVPGIIWVYFFYRQDRYEPEPVRLVIKAFIYGGLAIIPVAIIEFPFADQLTATTNPVKLIFLAVVIVGLPEEFFKLSRNNFV